MEVTNIDKGPRGINAMSGPVLVEVGQTVSVELTEAEFEVAKSTGWFEFSGEIETKPVDGKTAAEVLELSGGNFMAFKAEAAKLLGDKTPSTKAEIVAALEELATKP